MTAPLLSGAEIDDLFKEETWPKRCSTCKADHTEAQFEKLRYCGLQKSGMHDIPDMEIRRCGCGVSMAITVPRDYRDPNGGMT